MGIWKSLFLFVVSTWLVVSYKKKINLCTNVIEFHFRLILPDVYLAHVAHIDCEQIESGVKAFSYDLQNFMHDSWIWWWKNENTIRKFWRLPRITRKKFTKVSIFNSDRKIEPNDFWCNVDITHDLTECPNVRANVYTFCITQSIVIVCSLVKRSTKHRIDFAHHIHTCSKTRQLIPKTIMSIL